MAYYTADEMNDVLNQKPQYRSKLYCRGFLITTNDSLELNSYPFYGLWKKTQLNDKYFAYIHPDTNISLIESGKVTHFLIGHAYNPFSMEYQEKEILKNLDLKLKENKNAYWDYQSELTGVFCTGIVKDDKIMFETDCTGMQLVFYGTNERNMYITSHAKMVADICGFNQTKYIQKLINSKFYRYWGTFLPGDISPYQELTRVQPNFEYIYDISQQSFEFKRFFPNKKIGIVNEEEVEKTFEEISEIMKKNLCLISKKWPDKAAISVTGGRDSTATLASAKPVYDKLKYFSYQSQESESVDAKAAHKICEKLGLTHKIYTISSDDNDFKDIEIYRKILECNAGCIGKNNLNDVRKRAYFDQNEDFDVEVKSWVSELGRGEAQNKYNIKKWPQMPTAGYYRCMWKVIINPILIYQSNQVFKKYLKKYYNKDVLTYLPWMDYFYWEFSWSSGEGNFLTAEHRLSYDITIPYNNRKLLEKIFSIPLNLRVDNQIPIKIIENNNSEIAKTGVVVKNVAHTDLWTTIIRIYLKVFSKLGV